MFCLSCTRRGRRFSLDGRELYALALLGEGSYGFVHLVEDAASGARFALKELRAAPRADVTREVDAHRAVRHPNVARLIAWSAHDAPPSASPLARSAEEAGGAAPCAALLLLTLAARGSLAGAIAAARGARGGGPPQHAVGEALGEAEALALCAGLARGLAAMHSAGLAHRDVNPRNALLPDAGEGGGEGGAVLCDLGSAAPLLCPLPHKRACLALCEEAAARTSTAYRAPELWDCSPGPPLDGGAADVWALGCTLYACAWGASPFEVAATAPGGPLRLVEPCHSRTLGALALPPQPRHVGAGFEALLEELLAHNPAARPTAAEAGARMEALLAGGGAAGAAGRGK